MSAWVGKSVLLSNVSSVLQEKSSSPMFLLLIIGRPVILSSETSKRGNMCHSFGIPDSSQSALILEKRYALTFFDSLVLHGVRSVLENAEDD
jgi:hypothetical protein